MKKNIIICQILFSFLAPFQLKAQPRYLANNPIWVVSSSCYPGNCYSKTSDIYYYLKGDTIIENNNYHKLFKKELGYIFCPGSTLFGSNDTINPFTYLRDTLQQIRFWDGITDRLLYDFNLNIGDTVPNTAYGTTTVSGIDSIPVSNYFRKRFTLSNPDCSSYLYEGIGNSNGFLEPVICQNISSDCGYTLSCYGFNDTAWYPSINASSPCIIPSIPLEIQEHKNIDQSSEITISPNPSTSMFTISSDRAKIEKIKIMNTLGELLFVSDKINYKSDVDLTDFIKGIYIVHIYTENGIVGKKIIKE